MELLIERKYPKKTYVIGWLSVDGKRLCNTLEDTDRGLYQSMPTGIINSVKVAGKTAIPKGRYRVALSVSPKFKSRTWAKKYGGRVPEVLGVKGFTGIRIHPGVDSGQTDGCPLTGDNTLVGKLTNSAARFHELMSRLVPAWESGEEIWLTIR